MPPTGLQGDGTCPTSVLNAVNSFRIRRVFDYWITLRQGRQFPAWPDIKLIDLYDVAPYVAVFDVERDDGADMPVRVRYRFCGTWLVDARSNLSPSDPTGHFLDDVPWPFDPAPILAACDQVVRSGKPAFLGIGEVDEDSYHQHERCFFPLGDGAENVTQIIVCVDEVAPDDHLT